MDSDRRGGIFLRDKGTWGGSVQHLRKVKGSMHWAQRDVTLLIPLHSIYLHFCVCLASLTCAVALTCSLD